MPRTKGRKKANSATLGFEQTLFIDARQMGMMRDRTHRELIDNDIAKIAGTYHAWRGERGLAQAKQRGDVPVPAVEYEDVPGFCKSATLEEIRKHGHVLTSGRYVGAPPQEDDSEPFEEKMARLTKELSEQFTESQKLEEEIRNNLKGLGFDV